MGEEKGKNYFERRILRKSGTQIRNQWQEFWQKKKRVRERRNEQAKYIYKRRNKYFITINTIPKLT